MQTHLNGSSWSLLILGEQMFGLKNILKFSERNAAPLRKTVLRLPHIWPKTFSRSQGNSIKNSIKN